MTPLEVTLLAGFLMALALLVVTLGAYDEVLRENRRLRRRVHPSTRLRMVRGGRG